MTHVGDYTRAQSASDIRRDGWIDRLLPAPARPYARLMRLDRPIGTWLLLFPCWWGLFLAVEGNHPTFGWQTPLQAWILAVRVVLFAIGAVVMRGAGCTYNDIVDRDFDAKSGAHGAA
jgi:4-hydroxybenzoate polyprenyltransferase